MAEARTRYLAIEKPFNQVLAKVSALGDTPPLAPLKGLCRQLAAADDTAARQLLVGKWPPIAKAPIAAMITATTRERVGFLACARATNTNDAYAGVNDANEHGASSEAEAVRVALGLPGTN